ncbi:bifunctional phosphopantothenoylcysteine decarboxylase/phosphopantothenate--cysteine ligase CoaBC [Candidatus Desulfovibrio trichonymphae]|uniref:Coenzyme A biosynthesis bifunctional protein CoaBC n=1 Tax=Candidatus Desulfovibrio trichonymphae TaxID=1725232 RepID=A0A1J1DPI8_9BACT|nr:bifunctional phosphopantothenoylcysteine decarboxylase/phosphopantothenate--cysteine ligase CoaBC [Candidatus Desulfovibrio trichonymphae]BAV91759.1 phosphopantothenoylcysteine decarboxylase/phosphopantothenate-cysteine ligase [Candidatus Desulfovibrio trichonymphae]GHU91412.1 phosphopantothenoylcysteine decarboxylase [Deltaproteobacteria bacterium]GHV00750.1 phosphopantothenoylcysteine decarboxylase [Deltaproteobacteria bacterium]
MTPIDTTFNASTRFVNHRLHLGVCGSVACYKAADLLRAWHKLGIHVSVTLTAAAQRFVAPLLFESLGAMPVYQGMFSPGDNIFAHLEPGQSAEAYVIAPASADALSRLVHGAASDMLSAQALAFDKTLIIAPAMNPRMWAHRATRANAALLQERGIVIIEPACGDTACGNEGQGRLADLSDIFLAVLRALAPQDMAGRKVLVTLGPTREPWDGARFWSNPSSGRMGTAMAVCAWLRGAEVTAVCGPGEAIWLPPGIVRINVGSAREMFAAARDSWPQMDMGMFVAAVADFFPKSLGPDKFKKSETPQGFSIEFCPNPDILQTLAAHRRPDQKLLGFAAESTPDMESLLPLTREKRLRKNADLLAANRINAQGSGFGSHTNRMAVIDAHGHEVIWPEQSKADVAWDLCSWLLRI